MVSNISKFQSAITDISNCLVCGVHIKSVGLEECKDPWRNGSYEFWARKCKKMYLKYLVIMKDKKAVRDKWVHVKWTREPI